MKQSAEFLAGHQLVFSTLGPLHIGCGIDYEPTNYVMDGETLFGFDIEDLDAVLTEKDRNKLSTIVLGPSAGAGGVGTPSSGSNHGDHGYKALLSLRRFIYKRRELLLARARHIVSVAPQVAEEYHEGIGRVAQVKSEKNVLNQFHLQRTCFNPHSQEPLLPGSSVKGAIRTGVLNGLNGGKRRKVLKSSRLERELLGGGFQSDPMRMVKIGDGQWQKSSDNPGPRIIYDHNLYKKPHKADKKTRAEGKSNLRVMREVLPAMASRLFRAPLSLLRAAPELGDGQPKNTLALADIVRHCNRFYREQWEREMDILLKLGCLDPRWQRLVEELFRGELGELLDEGRALLLRVGRHSGAECVTIEGVRSIRIMGKKIEGSRYESEATTLWLAGEREDARESLIPFGWLVAEIDPEPEDLRSRALAEKLRDYNRDLCRREAERRADIERKRAAAEEELRERQRKEEEARRERERQEREAREREARLAALPPERRAMQEYRDMLEQEKQRFPQPRQTGLGSPVGQALAQLVNRAQSWDGELREELRELVDKAFEYLKVNRKKKGAGRDLWKKLGDGQ
ncbi:CRISPR-associated protein Csm5 [Microbulbifer thermotolerans]|uniref:RAMP superfamily CRISPR-associated protein n=1 Tax=Microbulbifer thermotolerans TaxID=252514 RepID=UPI0008E0D675|nr:RAMP superfamily CRISPR-associated protein [Microbulbifer thermotolerans]SFD09841.1 CRISPR-associated protein Csm5 [Microbulbifer thermotolerans]